MEDTMFTAGTIVTIVLMIFVGTLVAQGIRIVSQGEEWVIERFGAFHRTLKPGLSVIIPLFDKVAYRVVTKELVHDIEEQEVITSDNAVIMTNAVAFIRVGDPERAVYSIEDFGLAVRNLVQTTLRSIIGQMTLDEALSSREIIKTKLAAAITEDLSEWGIILRSVEVQDVKPSQSMQAAMEQQAAAERERKAMVTRAEGAKQSAILEAEGRLESAKRDANAEVTLAEGSKSAIALIAETTKDESLPLQYLLGQRYVEAIREMGGSENGKFVLLPADLHESVRGVLHGKSK